MVRPKLLRTLKQCSRKIHLFSNPVVRGPKTPKNEKAMIPYRGYGRSLKCEAIPLI